MDVASIRIGNGVAQFGDAKFPIANITSYRTAKASTSETPFLQSVGAFGLVVLFIWTLSDGADTWIGSKAIYAWPAFLASMLLVQRNPNRTVNTYSLRLRSAGGESQVFSTPDLEIIQNIERELDAAFSTTKSRP